MSYNFLPYEQDQLFLLPPSLDEWVEEGSLARFVSEAVDELDGSGELAEFYAGYRADGWGRAAYHPALMVKVILYGYCVGVRSSRKLARALDEQVTFRYLAANQRPDFRTISDFRKEHIEELDGLFTKVLELCKEAGLVRLGRVALDGRKVGANAALERNRTREGLEREVKKMLEEAERIDAEEDEKYGPHRRGDELPEGLRTKKDRLRRLREARERLEAEDQEAKDAQAARIAEREEEERRTGKKKRGRKPKPPEEVGDPDKKANMTDPESRIMKSRKGWVQGYNAQAAADCESQVIVGQDITQEENDRAQLAPMLERCKAQAGGKPEALLADAGYWSEQNAGIEDERTELFVATTKNWKRRKQLREQGPPRGRIPKNITSKERMERKLRTKRGRRTYKERSTTIEPIFGQMQGRGLNEFLLRGKKKVRAEWSLFCATHNLLKLWRSGWRPASSRLNGHKVALGAATSG